MKNPGMKGRLRDRLDIIGLLAFAVIVLFVAFPHLLFSQNVEEIPRAVTYYRYFFASAFIILVVLASISLYLPRRAALIAASVLGAYALLVLIFDLVHPLSIGFIEEGTEREPAAPVAGAIQVALMVAAFFAIYYIPKKARGVLAGFTQYRRCVSNYFNTIASYPSFMSGTTYSPDMTVREWHEGANTDSIINDVHERGFSSAFYGLIQRSGTRQAQVAYTDDPGGVGIVDVRLAADYWLLRVAPVALRHLVLDERGAGPVTRFAVRGEEVPTGNIDTLISYRQFRKFLADERIRPATGQYVHFHAKLPHPPHQLDRHGNYVVESSYEEQLLLATNMLLEFLAKLKELDRFENSLIIIHSDHGDFHGACESYAGDPLRDFILIDQSTSQAIAEGNVRNLTGAELESVYIALLLIKPPGVASEASGDLTVTDALVQLLDLREYISRGIDEEDWEHAYPEHEKVDVYHGLVHQLRNGTLVAVGRDIMSGYINHYIIRPGGEWEVADNIPFEWE